MALESLHWFEGKFLGEAEVSQKKKVAVSSSLQSSPNSYTPLMLVSDLDSNLQNAIEVEEL